MNQQLQNILYLIILAVILILFYAFYPKQTYTPHGIYLPQTDQTYEAVAPNQVQQLTVPPNATPIAIINTLIHFTSTNQNDLEAAADNAVSYAKTLAAAQGANSIGPIAIAKTPEVSPLDSIQIQTYAYRLNH